MKVSRFKNWLFCVAAFLAISPGAHALNNDLDLGSPNDGPLQKVGALMQQGIDFLGGPGVLFVAFLGFVIAYFLWVVVPKSSGPAIALLGRALTGAVVMFNIVLLFTWIQGI
ncbi:hypothetical protein V4W63_09685 [Pseudomonas aeruginosa]|uniref:hypothetical protein n=1 Tax=Pseudomonas aeruginosa TaxID=287 RepID=UPI0032E501F8|nr:hypothetical protein [Pseudomonas aeruginosa]